AARAVQRELVEAERQVALGRVGGGRRRPAERADERDQRVDLRAVVGGLASRRLHPRLLEWHASGREVEVDRPGTGAPKRRGHAGRALQRDAVTRRATLLVEVV